MADNKDRKPLVPWFALWKMQSGKGYSGKLGDARVVVFINDKKGNDKAPDLRVYLSEDEKREKRTSGGERQQSSAPRGEAAPPVDDSDIPF